MDDADVLRVAPFDVMGTPFELLTPFGGRAGFRQAVASCKTPSTSGRLKIPMSVRNLVKSIQDIMRQDSGVDGDAQRLSQLCWMFFLKIIDDQDQELEMTRDRLVSPVPARFQWRLGRRPGRDHGR